MYVSIWKRTKKNRRGEMAYRQKQRLLSQPCIYLERRRKDWMLTLDADTAYPQRFTESDVGQLLELAHVYWDSTPLPDDTPLFAGGTTYMNFFHLDEATGDTLISKAVALWDTLSVNCVTETIQ